MFLNSTVRDDNGQMVVELMNPDLNVGTGELIQKGLLHVFRAKLLWNDTLHEHIRIANYGLDPVSVTLSMDMDADYADIFEIRGFKRKCRGTLLARELDGSRLTLGYRFLDLGTVSTPLALDGTPAGDYTSALTASQWLLGVRIYEPFAVLRR